VVGCDGSFPSFTLPKEQFSHAGTHSLLATLDDAACRSGVSRGQAFEDFLHMTVCALSGGQMEDEYLAIVKRYSSGRKGERSCDRLAQLLGQLVSIMEETRVDILGDLFQGAITCGEAGQFFTPDSVADLMAMILTGGETTDIERKTVCDPCCGSGRTLLSIAKRQPHWEFIGQDIDLRCVRMTAINLALRNLYGYVIWGNSLAVEQRLVYRTGFNLRGFVRQVPAESCAAIVRQADPSTVSEGSQSQQSESPIDAIKRSQQLFLF